MNIRSIAVVVALYLSSMTQGAAATVIDFEGFPDGTVITNQIAGVTFSSGTVAAGTVATDPVDLEVIILHIDSNGDNSFHLPLSIVQGQVAPYLLITFDVPVQSLQFRLTTLGGNLSMTSRDSDGNIISVEFFQSFGSIEELVTVQATGIKLLEMGLSQFTSPCCTLLDDIEFDIGETEGPVTSNLIKEPDPAPINTDVILKADVDDSTTGGSNIFSAEYTIDGGTPVAMAPMDGSFEDDVMETVVALIPKESFPEAGVYEICVNGTDVAGNQSQDECMFLPVFDPTGGFVTGGGFIISPQGALPANPEATGKASFGFVSKYQNGATIPSGQTEFQFKMGDLDFHSTAYQWLVISGARAKYKGTGTINGFGNYGFHLTASDSKLNGGGDTDAFRIKIVDLDNSEELVYDNVPDDDYSEYMDTAGLQAIAGGSIVVHKK